MMGTELASTAWYDRCQRVVSESSKATPRGRDIFDGTVAAGVGAARSPLGDHEPTGEVRVRE